MRMWSRVGLLSLGLVAAAGGAARADCDLNLQVRNIGAVAITVPVSSAQTRSGLGASWGPWREAQRGGWYADSGQAELPLAPEATLGQPFRTAQGCGARREFRVEYVCQAGPRAGSRYAVSQDYPANYHSRFDIVRLSAGGRC